MSDKPDLQVIQTASDESSPEVEAYTSGFFSGFSETIKNLQDESKLDNVAIFVDYDNVYHGLMGEFKHDPDHPDPSKNLFEQLWNRYGRDNIRAFRAYADFEKLKQNLTSLQKKRVQIRHVYSNGKLADGRKNSSDIELCIDASDSTYKDKTITTYVFVTADSDMIPIMSRLMYRGKRVELFYLEKSAPRHVSIGQYAHHAETLESFLNVEENVYQIEGFVADALKHIENYYKVPRPQHWLGQGRLRIEFEKTFNIPSKVASDLLEYLRVNKLIFDGTHVLADGTEKLSIMLTDGAKGLLTNSVVAEAAPSKSTK